MRFMQVQGFSVRADRQVAFQRWLIENDGRIRGAYPPGTEYGGCYASVFSSEKSMGDSVWITVLDSYAALDTIAAAGKDPAHPLAAVQAELVGFFDPNPAAPYSNVLLKSFLDATVVDVPIE